MAGEARIRSSIRAWPSRFNEAPARWPGRRNGEENDSPRNSPGFNEAPARWPGRLRGGSWYLPCMDDASMRPRLGGRGGNHGPKGIGMKLGVASMRPRLGGRGGSRAARIRTPGSPSFNEAPARWPGRPPAGGSGGRQGPAASMRPRLGGRGGAVQARGNRNTVRRFNEAPARWPGRPPLALFDVRADPRAASMRPRLGGRGGQGGIPTVFGGKRLASMRPRLGGRGGIGKVWRWSGSAWELQ